jgi:hypothetical protein
MFMTVENLILILVTFLVTAGIKSLSALVGKDLSGTAAAITAGLVGLVISLFNTVLVPLIPAAAMPIIEPAAGLLIVILGAFGVHSTAKLYRSK